MAEESRKWEYLVKTLGSFWKGVPDDTIQNELNDWGEDGWEVVAIRTIENSNQATVIAKRPLSSAVRRARTLPSSWSN
jgi:hypothetical protein